jgi:membrane associated rhomboid family serine protease
MVKREPILHVPPVVTVTLVVFGVIHAVRVWLLSPRGNVEFLLLFAFIPARYDPNALLSAIAPGGFGAEVWTFVTYAFIHADVFHLVLNAVWFLAFGSAVARRFGAWRFLLFFAVTAAAGAAVHLVTHFGEFVPMVGASAAISGYMAAAVRFAFQRRGTGTLWPGPDGEVERAPAAPLTAALADPRVLGFLVVWFGINLLFGVGSLAISGGTQEVAWQAHIGGFMAGLLLFPLFDPHRQSKEQPPADAASGR